MHPRRWRARAAAAVVLALLVAGCSSQGPPAPASTPEPADLAATATASASSSATGTSPRALEDGDVTARDLGQEWRAADGDDAAWVQLSWAIAQDVASVQVFGGVEAATDPAQSTAAALHGTLRFSDGSSVVVSGIAAGEGMPTTVAFPPRKTTSVRLKLQRQVPTAPFALRELSAYDAASAPPVWPAPEGSPTYSVTAQPAADCAAAAPPTTAPTTAPSSSTAPHLVLACPAPGAAVEDTAVIAVDAPPGQGVTAWSSAAAGASGGDAPRRLATAVADASGRALLTADLSDLPRGPTAVEVTTDGAPQTGEGSTPLVVQLDRTAGTAVPKGLGASPPPGFSLRYEDDFDAPLSVSQSGAGAQYAALKPEPWGGSQFGDAVFADPAWGADTLATTSDGTLRVRVQPIGGLTQHQTWGQQHVGGLLSSQRFGGSGFSAQYGYFEARVLGAPGPGAWSAFWGMNSESGTSRSGDAEGEVDAVELYGHDTGRACYSTHAWGGPADAGGRFSCIERPQDWATQWHTYGVQVLPGRAVFFVDGEQVADLDQLSHTDEPFFFMLDLATGGGWPVDLSATGGTTDLYVDWVRVYT